MPRLTGLFGRLTVEPFKEGELRGLRARLVVYGVGRERSDYGFTHLFSEYDSARCQRYQCCQMVAAMLRAALDDL